MPLAAGEAGIKGQTQFAEQYGIPLSNRRFTAMRAGTEFTIIEKALVLPITSKWMSWLILF